MLRNYDPRNFNNNFFGLADLDTTQETIDDKSKAAAAKLQRWRAEQALKKKMMEKKKPIFKVGIVHHNQYYSPPFSKPKAAEPCHSRACYKEKHIPTPPKRITRATQKRLDAKRAGATTPIAPSVPSTKRRPKKRLIPIRNESFAPANYSFNAPAGLSQVPMFGRFVLPKITPEDLNINANSTHPPATFISQLNALAETNENAKNAEITENAENEAIESAAVDVTMQPAEPMDVVDTLTPPRPYSPVPASFSPYVVSSRGKTSARKEQLSRMGMRNSSANEIPTKETVMENLNISIEEEERTARYFKFLLEREIERLVEICNNWEGIKGEPDVPEEEQYAIMAAIGQTRLLLRKKFERFRRLVQDCETGKGEMLVQCKDLQGFWDLIYMEVKDCELRFSKLEFLRSMGWVEQQIVVASNVNVNKKKSNGRSKPKINSVKSSARSWIMAARKKKMLQDKDLDVEGEPAEIADVADVLPESPKVENSSRSTRKLSQSRDSMSKRRNSIGKSMPKQKTPVSLLKQVQLSQASKSIRSPLAVIKVSKMFKVPEVRLDDSISYVNSNQTPGKGILKKSEASSGDKSFDQSNTRKSMRKVDFKENISTTEEQAEEQTEEEFENSMDLGKKLALIDNCSFDDDEPNDLVPDKNITIRRSGKRLNFEDEFFNEAENSQAAESSNLVAAEPESSSIPTIVVSTPTPPPITERSSSKNRKRSIRRSISNIVDETAVQEPEVLGTRTLRNRIVTVSPDTSQRRSQRKSSSFENKNEISLNSSTKENNDPQRRAKSKSEHSSDALKMTAGVQAKTELTQRRRSSRKSVRFTGTFANFHSHNDIDNCDDRH